MRNKKKTVEQDKNRNSQKSVKSVRLMGIWVSMEEKIFGKGMSLAQNEKVKV